MSTYRDLWGHERTRTVLGHPKREGRRQRAAERFAVHVHGRQCRNAQIRAFVRDTIEKYGDVLERLGDS